MAKKETELPVSLSILDKLIDEDTKTRSEVPLTRAQSVRALKAALRRDLEWLLNSRACIQEPDEGSQELIHSAYTYGLVDISTLSFDSRDHHRMIERLIEDCIRRFEPRLERVRVSSHEIEGKQRQLRFTIEALLRMDPSPEVVSFDTFLELGSGACSVKGG